MIHLLKCLVVVAGSTLLVAGCYGWASSVEDSGLRSHQVGGYVVRDSRRLSKEIEAPSGLVLDIRPNKDKLNATILLGVTLLIPEGVSVRLPNPVVILQSPEWPQQKTLVVDHLADNNSRRYSPSAVLTGKAYEPDNVYEIWYSPTRATMEPQTGLPQARSFTVVLPAIEINGEVYQPKPVTFENYTKCGMFGCKY
jgi:hypothetical protein